MADLPATLNQATATLQKVRVFADLLAPATRNLLPAVQAIPAANAATIGLAKPITPGVLKNENPALCHPGPARWSATSRPASSSLATATPSLSKVFGNG